MELDADIGRVMDAIRAEAPKTIVIVTADNGAWQDAYPDAGTTLAVNCVLVSAGSQSQTFLKTPVFFTVSVTPRAVLTWF